MSPQASVDMAVPSKGELFVQSLARSVGVGIFARYFPDLAKDPSLALVIDFAVVFAVSLGMAWISSSATRRHALGAAVSAAMGVRSNAPGTLIPILLPDSDTGEIVPAETPDRPIPALRVPAASDARKCAECGKPTGFGSGPGDPQHCGAECWSKAFERSKVVFKAENETK